MKRGFYAGVNRTRQRSVKGVIADIEKALKSEPEGSVGRQQFEQALAYWKGQKENKK
mgnify:CR=1 FL=1